MHACVPSLVFAGVGLIIACVFVAVVNLAGLEFFLQALFLGYSFLFGIMA